MKIGLWQLATIQQFVALLEPNQAIKALILVGSNANAMADPWSDVDLVCVIENDALDQFFQDIRWLAVLGDLLGFEQSASPFKSVTRLCFNDFRRVDLIFLRERIFEQSEHWNYSAQDTRLLFSRSAIIDAALSTKQIAPREQPIFDDQQFARMTHQFWFKASVAVTKVMRNDLLISAHLALDLARDCLMFGMVLRDIETGDTVHRYGGLYNEIVDQVSAGFTKPTRSGILDFILQCARTYDALALGRSTAYMPKAELLQEWISYAKALL